MTVGVHQQVFFLDTQDLVLWERYSVGKDSARETRIGRVVSEDGKWKFRVETGLPGILERRSQNLGGIHLKGKRLL